MQSALVLQARHRTALLQHQIRLLSGLLSLAVAVAAAAQMAVVVVPVDIEWVRVGRQP
jgi:hypothetical protein